MFTFDIITLLKHIITKYKFSAHYMDRLYDLQTWKHNYLFKSCKFITNINPTTNYPIIIYQASVSGYLELVKIYLYNSTDLFKEHCADIWRGKLNVIKWAHTNNIPGLTKFTERYHSSKGNLEELKYIDQIRICEPRIIYYAVIFEQLEIIKWIHFKYDYRIQDFIIKNLRTMNNHDVLDWLTANNLIL